MHLIDTDRRIGRLSRFASAHPRDVVPFEVEVGDFGEGKTVKGVPLTGEIVIVRDMTLADGNKIHNESQSKLYRDAEGRVRRELGVDLAMPAMGRIKRNLIVITDPVAGTRSGDIVVVYLAGHGVTRFCLASATSPTGSWRRSARGELRRGCIRPKNSGSMRCRTTRSELPCGRCRSSSARSCITAMSWGCPIRRSRR